MAVKENTKLFWRKYNLHNGIYYWQIGNVCFWIKKEGKVWQIANCMKKEFYTETQLGIEVDEPANLTWKTFIAEDTNHLFVLPALPNKPLVLKPINSFILLPSASKQLYVHVPVWVQLYAGSVKKENLLTEFCTTQLSNSWFGDTDNGTLAYALPSELQVEHKPELIAPNETVCPVHITNNSSQQLNFQRFLIQSDCMTLYITKEHLYCNELKVRFKGEPNTSDASYASQAPSIAIGAKLLSQPRSSERNMLKRSLFLFKSLTEF